jgi:hypothetical protein
VELFARHFGAERVLIVCPTSLKQQWQRELGRFTDRRSQVIGGLRAARQAQYAQEATSTRNYAALGNCAKAIAPKHKIPLAAALRRCRVGVLPG